MQKDGSIYLVIGPKGSGKNTIIDALRNQISENDIVFAHTLVACPNDMKHNFERNKHFKYHPQQDFVLQYQKKAFALVWSELNEKQEAVPETWSSSELLKQIEINGATLRAVSSSEVNTAVLKKKALVVNLSNAVKLPPANVELKRPDPTGQNFSLLHEAIQMFQRRGSVKVIFVRAPKKLMEERLKTLSVYNDTEIERVVEHGNFVQSEKNIHLLEKYLLKYNVSLSFVDNNASIGEGARRLQYAMADEENGMYLQGKIDAKKYMSDVKVNELLEYLLNLLLVEKPDNPTDFLIKKLTELKSKSTSEILNRQDVETMYDLIDVTGKGSITTDQLIKCLENLGVEKKQVESVKNSTNGVQSIDKKKFFSIVSNALNILRDTPYAYIK